MSLLVDAEAARPALRRRDLSVVELVEQALRRATALQDEIGAFVTLTPELALAQAAHADDELRLGCDRGPLHGLPLAVKDVIDVAGVPTGLGSRGPGHRVPESDAAAVRAAVAAGAVVIGKSATPELAFSMVTPGTSNPFDSTRTVGGSSGGSAAALAMGAASIALGTDTNGSIRCPAALCGVYGLKPTFGAVPRTGVAALAWSQDTVGAMASTAAGCASLHAALTGGSAPRGPVAEPRGIRIGVNLDLCRSAAPAVADAVLAALDDLADRGAEIVEIRIPDPALAGSASLVTMFSEAASAWEIDAHAEGAFGTRTRAALKAGGEIPAVAYLRASRARTLLRTEMRTLFASLHVIAMPSVPVTAAPAEASTVRVGERELPVEAAHGRFTALASVTGHPAVSLPCGLDADGLPIGLQLVGPLGGDKALLRLAMAAEDLPGARAVAAARRAVLTDIDERIAR